MMITHSDRFINIRKFVTYRLPHWKNRYADMYWEWCKEQRREGYEWHHLLKRQYGHLFIVRIKSEDHTRIHNSGYKTGEYEELFIQALQNLINFIENILD